MSDEKKVPEVEEEQTPKPQKPLIVLRPSSDSMELEMLFQRLDEDSPNPEYDDVMAAIAEQGVKAGINEVAIRALCTTPMYNRPMMVARGQYPKQGEDGYLNYIIRQSRDLKPKLLEDGTVDYRDLGYVNNVNKDQPLCEVHLPTKGQDGFDIFGNVLEGIPGRQPPNVAGRNTYLNDEGTMIYAAVDGNAEVVQGVIHVVDTMRIHGNIDNSTGDIEFVGDIYIEGDIVSGFKVTSQYGSITIKGSVEAATIRAAGDIIVGTGINGMNRGSIIAGGTVKCKFIQSCYIEAEENIFADSIMYCTIQCGGNVELGGKRAVLIGGKSTIAGALKAKTIGTDSHVASQIIMAATGMAKNQELLDLKDEIKTIDTKTMQLVQTMTRYEDLLKKGKLAPDQAKEVLSVKDQYLQTVERRKTVKDRIDAIEQEQLDAGKENSYIQCSGRIHVGVSITFGPLNMVVKQSFTNSRVQIVDNNIKVMPQ